MLVAITGANGFIGRNLTRHFESEGWTVQSIVRRDFETDLFDRKLFKADVVVHAAGATRAPTHAQLVASNVTLTARVIDAARRGKVGRVIFISSQAAAGPAKSADRAVSEDTDPAPIEPYGRSKLDAELLVREAADVPFVIVRPAAVYGPYDRDFIAMFRLARRGVAMHAANRDQWISIVHVDDLARSVLVASSRREALGGTFFVANERPTQWRELFQQAALVTGRRIGTDVEVPAWLVRAGAVAGDVVARITGRAGLLTSGKFALAQPRYWVCSSERIRATLGFVTMTGLHDGLAETYRWYLAQGWL
jgi:nucleoside-diphosphate-sugar epimerase